MGDPVVPTPLFQFDPVVPVIAAAKDMGTVTISPVVQQQIRNFSTRDRKRIDAATKAGNRFIPYYLDGSYYLIVDEEVWVRNIRPLVNKNSSDWYDMLLKRDSGLELAIAKNESTNQITICPQVELVLFQVEPELIKLAYRTRIVNVHRYKQGQPILVELVLDESIDYQEVAVGIDKNGKVDYVEPKYYGTFGSTISFIDGYKSLIENAQRDLERAASDQQGKINEDIRQYKGWIKLFQEQEVLVCKAN